MNERKPGLFGSLFQRKKKGVEIDLSLPGILAMTVGRSLSAVAGTTVSCSVETVDWERFRGESASVGSGYVLNSFGASEQYGISLVFPEAFTARWTSALAAAEPDLDKGRLVAHLLTRVAGPLPRLVRLRVEADDGQAAVQPLAVFPKKCAARDMEELLWRAAGCRIYRLNPISDGAPDGVDGAEDAVPDGTLYVLIDLEEAERLSASLDNDDVFRAVAGRLVGAADGEGGAESDTEETPRIDEATAPRSLAMRFPRELVLANFLLLPKVPCGKYTGEAQFQELSANADPRAYSAAPGTWVRLSCSLSLPAASGAAPGTAALAAWPWAVHLFFPASDAGKAAQAQNTCKQVASCFFQAGLGFLKGVLGATPSQPGVGLGMKPDFAGSKGQAVWKGRISVAGTRMPVEAFLDYGTVSWLLRLFCDPWDVQAAPRGAEAALPLLLSLNQSLLRRWLPTFHRRFLDVEPASVPGAPPRERLPFSVFLDLLGDRDARIVLQNHVLLSLGDRDIRSLYRTAVRGKDAEGNEIVRIATPRAFDETRLKSFLTRRALEDWQAANPDRLADPAGSRELSDGVLKGIREAVRRKQLMVSPKVALILDRMFLPGARGESKRKMEQASLSKEPFETLHAMPRPVLQQFLGVQSNQDLCLILVGADAELPLIKQNISRNKCRTLEEDLEIQRQRRDADELDPDPVIEAKQRLGRGARETLEALEKEKKAARPEPGQTAKFKGWAAGKPASEESEDLEDPEEPRAKPAPASASVSARQPQPGRGPSAAPGRSAPAAGRPPIPALKPVPGSRPAPGKSASQGPAVRPPGGAQPPRGGNPPAKGGSPPQRSR